MPPLREVKNRIRSVKNISQITRALEAVSASRVRKAQARVLASRAFAEKAWEILLNVQNATKGAVPHPLLTEREEVKAVMVVVVTSDRGLAGSYNSNIIRVAERFVNRFGKPVQFVTVGRKGRDTLARVGANIVAEFSDLPAEPGIADIAPIARLAKDAFLSGEVDEVMIAYTDFINMLTQRPVILSWLPLTPTTTANQVVSEYVKDVPTVTDGNLDYEYEPNAAAVIDEIVPRFTELQLYQALLEALASEHAARMAAMRNATDNASQLVDDLTLEYNKARQASITNEILDIVGGANALQQSIENAAKQILKDADKKVKIIAQNGKAEAKTEKKASAKPASKPAPAKKVGW
jgi:F-type H+-transporting ATPase subunit gamma